MQDVENAGPRRIDADADHRHIGARDDGCRDEKKCGGGEITRDSYVLGSQRRPARDSDRQFLPDDRNAEESEHAFGMIS